jgi:hypothetical protein
MEDLHRLVLVDEEDEYLCLMSFDEFTESVELGGFIDYDGCGSPFLEIEGKKYYDMHVRIYPSEWTPEYQKKLEEGGWIGINWFNR